MSANEGPADALAPSDAFGALANEVRTEVLEAMAEAEAEGRSRMRFSELFEESDAGTTAGFAYHVDALLGPYLRKVESETEAEDGRHGAGYELTTAGRTVARGIAAGRYAPRADRSVPIDDPCPFCGEGGLEGRARDGVLAIECGDCDRSVLSLTVPAGLDSREELPAAFDRHHRHRLAAFADGLCPECGGSVDRTLVPADGGDADDAVDSAACVDADGDEDVPERVQAAFACRQCGHRLRSPVTHAVKDHPAVAAFYHDHGRTVGDRPLWNVGREWAESVLSDDPPCVRVVADLGGDTLALYVDRELAIREIQRTDRPVPVSSPT